MLASSLSYVPSSGMGKVVNSTTVSLLFCCISSLMMRCCARQGRSLKDSFSVAAVLLHKLVDDEMLCTAREIVEGQLQCSTRRRLAAFLDGMTPGWDPSMARLCYRYQLRYVDTDIARCPCR